MRRNPANGTWISFFRWATGVTIPLVLLTLVVTWPQAIGLNTHTFDQITALPNQSIDPFCDSPRESHGICSDGSRVRRLATTNSDSLGSAANGHLGRKPRATFDLHLTKGQRYLHSRARLCRRNEGPSFRNSPVCKLASPRPPAALQADADEEAETL